MMYFYKLHDYDNGVSKGSGTVIPEGYTLYNPDDKPQELLDAEFNMLDGNTQLTITMEVAKDMVDAHIKAEIDAFNELNGVSFDSVHNCESYSRVATYPHATWCGAVWLWSVNLWVHMRTWQAELLALGTLPTEAEIRAKIAELPFTDTVIVPETV